MSRRIHVAPPDQVPVKVDVLDLENPDKRLRASPACRLERLDERAGPAGKNANPPDRGVDVRRESRCGIGLETYAHRWTFRADLDQQVYVSRRHVCRVQRVIWPKGRQAIAASIPQRRLRR